MNEKRFDVVRHLDCPKYVYDKKSDELFGVDKAVILLNTFNEENEQLRQKLDFYLLDEFEWKEKYGD